MADTSKIEWTDATWQPITGCTLVSDGCDNCYAAKMAATRLKNHPSRKGLTRRNAAGLAKFTGEVRFNEGWLDQPLRWRKPRRIFVCAHGDLFHENVPDEWIDRVFAVMALCPQHTFQILTKRADRMREYYSGMGVCTRIAEAAHNMGPKHSIGEVAVFEQPIGPILENGQPEFGYRHFLNPTRWPLPNIWLGVSVEDQPRADERIPALLATPAAIRFVSAEPLLKEVRVHRLRIPEDIGGYLDALRGEKWIPGCGSISSRTIKTAKLDWVIVGGESGSNARPMHPDWARSLRDQCQAAGVPFFFKQWGEWAEEEAITDAKLLDISNPPSLLDCRFGCFNDAGQWGESPSREFAAAGRTTMYRAGKKAAGCLLDGREWKEMPNG